MSMNTSEIITALAANPGSTAKELGTNPVVMSRLAEKGLVVKVGLRKGASAGRPPVEWATPEHEVKRGEEITRVLAPVLPRISPELRRKLDASEREKVDYIESVFDNKRGEREKDDYALLRLTYDRITAAASRRVNAPMVIIEDDEQEVTV